MFDDEDLKLFDSYNDDIKEQQLAVADYYGFDVDLFSPLSPDGEPQCLGIFDREEDCIDFKTLGAKRYCAKIIKKNKEVVKTTIAGLPKKAGQCIIKTVDDFQDELYWNPKQSKKLMCHYLENMEPTEWRDKLGNVWHSDDKYGIMLEPIGFSIGLASEYVELLNILNGNIDTDYFDSTKIIRDYALILD